MTGIGTLSLQNFGRKQSAEARAGCTTIMKERLPMYNWKNAKRMLYGWYYDTQATFHNRKLNPDAWRVYNKIFPRVLVRNQNKKGYWEVPGKQFGPDRAGRIFATTLACLQLEVYYRNAHLRTEKDPDDAD